jgi:hypothetical protein
MGRLRCFGLLLHCYGMRSSRRMALVATEIYKMNSASIGENQAMVMPWSSA